MKLLLTTTIVLTMFIGFEAYACGTCGTPGTPDINSPNDVSCVDACEVTLDWYSRGLSDVYYIYIDCNNPPTTLIVEAGEDPTQYTWYGAEPGKIYYWRIQAENLCGSTSVFGDFSSVCSFVTAPAQATNPSPPNGVSDVNISSMLEWTPAGATSHYVYFGNDQNTVIQGIWMVQPVLFHK
jgi:hypothetical protein